MAFSLKGKVHRIGKVEQVTETFKKRNLVVEFAENPTYPEFVQLEVMQDKTSLLDPLKVGDEVEAHFNIRGREWTDKAGEVKTFTTLNLWRVEVLAKASAPVNNAKKDDDDLPF